MDDAYVIGEVSEPLFLLINSWHAEHPGEPLSLSGANIAELAGCACHDDDEERPVTTGRRGQ
jgi:hypothetical protein